MFADCHLHLLAYARALTDVDLGPAACPTISDVLDRLREVAKRRSGWVVARGFDDALASPPRLLSREELDLGFAETPVRIRHRTGHASLLNSAALKRLSSLPDGAELHVDSVLLVGAESWLDSFSGRPERRELVRGLREANLAFGSAKVTRVWDASPRNERTQRELLDLVDEAEFSPELRLMAAPSAARKGSRASAVKLFPSDPSLDESIRLAHRAALPVAIHATEPWEIEVAVSALERRATPELKDRIEHATLISSEQAERLAAIGAAVVANPGWIISRAPKYQAQLSVQETQRVMPLATILSAGTALAFGSDAPVDQPYPQLWLRGAVDRAGPEAITREQALCAAQGAAVW